MPDANDKVAFKTTILEWFNNPKSWLRQILSTRFIMVQCCFWLMVYTIIKSFTMWELGAINQTAEKIYIPNFTFAITIVQLVIGLIAWYIGNRTYQHKKEMDVENGNNNNKISPGK